MNLLEFPGIALKRCASWRPITVALAAVALWAAARPQSLAASTLITFDDLSAPLNSSDIPRPYHGLIFSGAPYPAVFSSENPMGVIGVKNGVVSGTNVLLSSGQSSGIVPFRAGQGAVFTLQSVYFTSAIEDSLQVQALGFTKTGPMLESIFTVTNTGPTLVEFDWKDLDSLEFTGLHPRDKIYFDTRFVIDDLTVDTAEAPEPRTMLLFGTGILLVLLGSRRWHLPTAKGTLCFIGLLTCLPASQLFAACQEGTVAACLLNGKQGKHECISGRWSPCELPPDPPVYPIFYGGVPNYSFESGDLKGWTASPGTTTTVARNPHSGSYSLAIGGSAGNSGVYQEIAVPEGPYVISAWVQVNPGVTASLWVDDGAHPSSARQAWQGSTTGFRYISVPINVPSTGRLVIHLWIAAGSGTVYWDDVSVTQNRAVVNYGFETADTRNWVTWPGTTANAVNAPHSGSYSLAVSGPPATSGVYQDILAFSGQQYVVSAWVQVSAGVTASLWLDDGANPSTTVEALQSATSGWQYVSALFTGNYTRILRIHLWTRAGNGTVYWDDVSVVPVAQDLANPGFESPSLAGWKVWPGSTVGISNNAHTGSHSLSMTGASSGVTTDIAYVNGDSQMVISAWVLVPAGTVVSLWLDDGYNPASQRQVWQSTTAGFQHISMPYSTSSASKMCIHLWIVSGSGTVYWDDVSVVAGNNQFTLN